MNLFAYCLPCTEGKRGINFQNGRQGRQGSQKTKKHIHATYFFCLPLTYILVDKVAKTHHYARGNNIREISLSCDIEV